MNSTKPPPTELTKARAMFREMRDKYEEEKELHEATRAELLNLRAECAALREQFSRRHMLERDEILQIFREPVMPLLTTQPYDSLETILTNYFGDQLTPERTKTTVDLYLIILTNSILGKINAT